MMRKLMTLLSTVLLSALAWAQLDEVVVQPSLDPAQISAPFVPGELVVGLETSDLALPALAMQMVGTIASQNPAINSYVIRLAPNLTMQDAGEFLRALPGVRYVEPNYVVFATATPNDPLFSQQYGSWQIQAHLAWDLWRPQRTVNLAILDTGIDANHPDLVRKMRYHSNGQVYGYNTLENNTDTRDRHGHGTHCAGIAAADINNGVGIAGVASWNPQVPNSHAYVRLMPVKVLGDSGRGTFDAVARGITWAVDNGAHILSLSLGSSAGSQQMQDAINYAWSRGCLVVAAAGNNASSEPFYPAYYTNCIAVAATDSNDRLARFSQYGSWVDIAAPGVHILSTIPNNNYAFYSGTSMACPYVSGVAALVWSHAPNLTNAQLRTVLETNIDPYLPYDGRTIAPGAGRVNAYRALRAADNVRPVEIASVEFYVPNPVLDDDGRQFPLAGRRVNVRITLREPAPRRTEVRLRSSHPSILGTPERVYFEQGQRTVELSINTNRAHQNTDVTVTASHGDSQRNGRIRLYKAVIRDVRFDPSSVRAGDSFVVTITMAEHIPNGGYYITISNSNRNVVEIRPDVRAREGRQPPISDFRAYTRRGSVSRETSVTITFRGENGEVFRRTIRVRP